jgi:carboxymethylenebutenolidase
MVEIQAAGEKVPAYVALPAAGAARGGVVVAHEWWGLNEQIKGVAERLAAEGYAAIVPDLYRGVVAGDPEKAHELMRGLQDGRASSILRAAASYLQAQEDLAGRRTGIMGFCMGGRLALLAAMDGKELAGAVMFYGAPVIEKERLSALSAPVLGLFGAQDKGIPLSDVKAFETAAKAAGKNVEIQLYEGAGHAFFNETRPAYNKDAAADAWKRTLAFFERALGR